MEIITSTSDLEKKVKDIIKNAEFVAIDTEFVREKTYYAGLGLIQIGYNGIEFAVDPVDTNIDLKSLNKVLQDEKIIKVFHACGQDVEIFYNLFDEIPNRLFDTQIAAKLLGFGESISYGKLVEHYCDVKLDKSARYTDWMRRPLEDEQVEYALCDVSYLQTVYEALLEDLKQKGRLDWANEEMEKLDDPKLYYIDPDDCWEKLKIRSKDKKYLALVKSIARYREHTAQLVNKPRGWILKDDAIHEIASIKPTHVKDLKKLRFFRFDEKMATELIGIVDYGLNEEEPPVLEKRSKFPTARDSYLTILRILLKERCERHEIAASVVCTADDLKEMALGNEVKKIMSGWRYEVFGKYVEKLSKGELAITADKNRLLLIEPNYK